MKIFRPVKTDLMFQGFGENLACIKLGADGKPVRPFKVIPGVFPNTCPAGCTKFYTAIGMKGHNGWDSGLYHGEPIYFPVVAENVEWLVINEVDPDGGLGVNVYAQQPVAFDSLPIHTPGQHEMIKKQYELLGGKVYPMFKFWHLLEFKKKNHEFIVPGELLGLGDTTGASSGDHLHWCMKIHGGSTNGFGFSIDSDNGYTGALDHKPYYENKFILDVVNPPFQFKKPMSQGETSVDAGVMQALLVRWGYMQPFKADESGIYGPKTSAAVLKFQMAKIPDLSWYEKTVLRGTKVGPKTLAALNTQLSA